MSWIAADLYRRGMVKLGLFKLTSGLESPFYIDLRRLYSYPELAVRVVERALSTVPFHGVEVVAGVETAGIPLAAFLACRTGLAMAYVRKNRKNHATGQAVEGDVANKRVMVVDDVVTTGGTLLRSINYLREAGATVVRALVVVDREQGARRLLASNGVEFYALTTAREIFETLWREGLIAHEDYRRVVDYLDSFRQS